MRMEQGSSIERESQDRPLGDLSSKAREAVELPQASVARSGPSRAQELVHDLRNSLAALSFGLDALDRVRSDEQEFATMQSAMKHQFVRLKEQIGRAVTLLETIK